VAGREALKRTLWSDNFANGVTCKSRLKTMLAGNRETEKQNDPDSVIYQVL